MAHAGRILVWWDRDVDQAGRPIRPDVRLAGREIWEQACRRTEALLDDHGPAAELMENSVAQVSRYLDRIGAPTIDVEAWPSHDGLLPWAAALCGQVEPP